MHSLRLSELNSSASDTVLEPPLLAGTTRWRVWIASDLVLVSLIAAGACALHFFAASRYGYFRDELYYAACGQHLAWGYVDHAPLIAVIAWFVRRLFGDLLFSRAQTNRLFLHVDSFPRVEITTDAAKRAFSTSLLAGTLRRPARGNTVFWLAPKNHSIQVAK